MSKVLKVLLCVLSPIMMHAQTVEGKWQTIDDRNGNAKAIVEIYKKDGAVYGKILKILEKGRQGAVCEKCEGDLKGKPIEGMEIITAFKESEPGEYKGKRLFDPEQAMTFRGKLWLDPDNPDQLKVRGYLAFIYRTQTWLRLKD
ncbi:DUF2147 domain-containing protein [Croceivirga sp. JEA036]|uniref:DUF2147 domain-containing protein n=1 Tax=Croceivirga sp. JEA036 TaxID=2721162 RepID=UPI00143990AD|nr:DUF2147 domain-containing protein [Croceivirga sp. JEA036]NJB37900.1 DUF2147 domain-containing protein [Croceivirga sp. JEA036]